MEGRNKTLSLSDLTDMMERVPANPLAGVIVIIPAKRVNHILVPASDKYRRLMDICDAGSVQYTLSEDVPLLDENGNECVWTLKTNTEVDGIWKAMR